MVDQPTAGEPSGQPEGGGYPATLSIDYPDRDLNRVSTGFRLFTAVPIAVLLATLGEILVIPTLLMIVVRRKYPRWWYDWNLQLVRFSTRVFAYLWLMDDGYPATDEEQYAHVEFPYPDTERDVSQFMPLVKWLLVIPHLIVLVFLYIGVLFAVIFTWFVILFTGRYPRGVFDYVEGVMRWHLRVAAYAFILVTDEYPPFRLAP
jgi:hypothetical protein